MRIFARIAFLLALAWAALAPAQATSPGVLFSSCPTINNLCPSLSLDFTKQKYWTGGEYVGIGSVISLTRASPGLVQDSNGTWYSFGPNVPRITNQGFLIEEARSNKCTNYNANPTDATNMVLSGDAAATLTVVDDTAALLAAGLQNIATSGKVYKLDNSGGSTRAIATAIGTTGNTNAYSLSVYARLGAGASQLRFNGATQTSVPSSAYSRVVASNIVAGTTGQQFGIQVDAGSVVYFILNQLEEGSFVTSPIVIAGASASRAADVPSLTNTALTKALAAKAMYAETNGVLNTGGVVVTDASFTEVVFSTSTGVRIRTGSGGVTVTLGSGTISGMTKAAAGFDSSSMTILANGGSKGSSAFPFAWSGAVYLGNALSGAAAVDGYFRRLALSPVKGYFDTSTQLPYLLKRDVIPGTPANDNTPMFLNEAA